MSLLADLLSKIKWGESHGGKGIPPTLAKAQGKSPKGLRLKNRYVIVSLLSVAVIAIGIISTTQLGRLSSFKQAKLPLPPRADTPVAPPPQEAPQQAPPTAAPPQAAERQDMPRITLEPRPAPLPEEKTEIKPKGVKPGPQRRVAGHAAPRKAPGVHAAKKAAAERPAAPKEPRREAILPPRIDTAARGALLYTARAAELSGDWRGAVASYHKALEIDPDNYRIMNNVAAALNNLGMFDEAARESRRALERKPDYVPAMINAAIACSAIGNNQEALRLFSAATATDPGNRGLVINLGILQERIGKLDDALATYRRPAASGDPQALHGMGRIYERKGNRIEALNAYRRIVAMPDVNPSLKREVKERLARLEE